jgi:hypothetical protein
LLEWKDCQESFADATARHAKISGKPEKFSVMLLQREILALPAETLAVTCAVR